MATTLYLGNASVTTPMSGDTSLNLMTSQGSSSAYFQRSTSASGDHLLLSSTITPWWSMQVQAVTISGSISFNMWALESNMSANVCIGVRIARYDSSGTFVSDVVANANANHKDDAEVTIDSAGTTPAVVTWTATPTSTAFSNGDWLVIEPHIDAIGTMGGGYTARLFYNDTAANLAQSYVTFTETITEYTTTQTVTLGLLDAAPALYAPSLAAGPVSVTLTLLDASPALYAPVLAPKSTVTLGLLDAAPALYAPTVAVGPVGITLGLLDASGALYAPTVAIAVPAQTITLPRITPPR